MCNDAASNNNNKKIYNHDDDDDAEKPLTREPMLKDKKKIIF